MDQSSFALIVAAARREVEKALASADRKAVEAFAPAFVVKDGHLLMQHGGTVADLGDVVGPRGMDGFGIDGKDGKDGQSIKGQDGRDGIDGVDGNDGRNGRDGIDGKDGNDGVGVATAYVSNVGALVIELTDGRKITAGMVRGKDGKDGKNGTSTGMIFGGGNGGSTSGGGSGGSGSWLDITDTPTTLAGYGITDAATAAQGALAVTALQPGASIPWTTITGKPAFFSGAYDDLSGKPALFDGAYSSLSGTPSTFAPSSHSHATSDVTGLDTALSGKLESGDLKTIGGGNIVGEGDFALFRGLALPMKPAAGVFFGPATSGAALGTVAQVANRNCVAPFISGYDMTIDQVAISVSTAVASSLAKVVIYSADAYGRPDAVAAEGSDIDCASTGTKTSALAFTFQAGRVYWIGVRSNSNQTLRSLPAAAFPVLSYTTAATPVIQTVLVKTETYATAAGSWGYSLSTHSNLTVPMVLMRAA